MRLLGIAPICLTCQRFLGVEPATGYVCEAFATGIPVDVLASRVDHRDPVEGDGGLRYRPKAEQDEAGYCAVSKDDMRCEGCQRYQQPNGCKIVAGQISPLGWCPGYEASAGVRADSVVAQLQPSRLDSAGELVKAAGIMFVTKDGKVLVLRRTEEGDRPGKWAFPGGKLEDGETPEQAAVREADEEIGEHLGGARRLWMRRVKDGVDFTTFLQVVDEPFVPTLNDEHDAYEWIDGHGLAAVARSAARQYDAEEYLDNPVSIGTKVKYRGRLGVVEGPLRYKKSGGPWVFVRLSEPGKSDKQVSVDLKDVQIVRADAEFQESEHPRGQPDNPGQFVKGAGGAKSAHLVDAPDRDKWPAHIKKLKLPPAWHSVRVSEDPKASLQAVGYDSKNRPQYVYSARFSESQTAKKFTRIKLLDSKFERVLSQNQRCLNSKDPVRREHALVTSLVLEMGLRPGSERETGAAEKAYGATTLRSEHVLSDGVDTFLRFTGKKGVKLLLKVEDPALAKELKARSRKTKDQLFPEVTAASLRRYVGSLGGGGFKTKDVRTLKATRLATDLVASESPPKNEAAYKRAVREVATKVAKVLGNTPTVCLQSYIPPVVFAPWRGVVGGAEARADADWKEEDHPRGQPGNADQFGPGGGGAAKPAEETKPRGDAELGVLPRAA